MIQISADCIRQHRDQKFNIKEQASEVVFLNASLLEIHQIQIDGCVFGASDSKRCDWLINVHGTNTSIFVELKGSDIEAAFLQLAETQAKLFELVKLNIVWIISYSGSPRFNTTIQKLALTARSQYNRARLVVKESPYTHIL